MIYKKNERTTAVSRNCEFCGKFTFTFRKNFLSLTENNSFRSSQLTRSGGTLYTILETIDFIINLLILLFLVIMWYKLFLLEFISTIKYKTGKPLYKWNSEKSKFEKNYVETNILKKLFLKLNL
jgi:hypothetical protein